MLHTCKMFEKWFEKELKLVVTMSFRRRASLYPCSAYGIMCHRKARDLQQSTWSAGVTYFRM